MKRNMFLLAMAALSSVATYGQNELDVYKMSRNDLSGTARSVSMGGAFGALGGDLSGVAINPAGIAIYRGSEFATTLNFQNSSAKTSIANGYDLKDNKFKFSFSNLGYVASVPIDNYDMPRINFGFAYNRLKTFDRTYTMDAGTQNYSLTDYIAVNSYGVSEQVLKNSTVDQDGYINLSGGVPWLPALAYQAYLINPNGFDSGNQMYKALNAGEATTPWLKVKERGSVDKYDFTAGTTIADQLSLGITISVTDINYRMYSDYQEGFAKANNNGFSLKNDIHTEGSGFQVGLGLIYKPVNALRFGLSYQSPTWYSMTDHFSAAITENVSEYLASNIVYNPNFTKNTGTSYAEYNMRTPDKWTLSIAGVIGQAAIISADYELTNYKNMKLSDDDDKIWTNSQKQYISEDFKAASTLRLGAEVRFTPQFSGRVGYMWQQSPLEKNFRDGLNEVVTGGTINHFTLDGDANYFTYGLGYRFSKSFYTDVAFVMRSQESDLYPFSNIFFDDKSTLNVVPAKLKTNTFSGLLTMGFRF